MALKTAERTSANSSTVVDDSLVLELSLYHNLTIGTSGNAKTYIKGNPYRFSRAYAMKLLAEEDMGRPIWKMYRPMRKSEVQKSVIKDETAIEVPVEIEPVHGIETEADGKKRIDIGTDEEIAEILNRSDTDLASPEDETV